MEAILKVNNSLPRERILYFKISFPLNSEANTLRSMCFPLILSPFDYVKVPQAEVVNIVRGINLLCFMHRKYTERTANFIKLLSKIFSINGMPIVQVQSKVMVYWDKGLRLKTGE